MKSIEGTVVWYEGDEEAGIAPRRDQTATRGSRRHIRGHSRCSNQDRIVGTASALPIVCRSVSQDIDEAERTQQAKRAKAKTAVSSKLETIDWHKLSSVEIEKRLQVNLADGLSQPDVNERLREYGENIITHPSDSWLWKVAGYFFKGFGSILCIEGVLVFICWKPLGDSPQFANLALGIVVSGVVLLQAFNAFQDWSCSHVRQSITEMVPDSCHLIRERALIEVSSTNVVPGDILLLKAGDRIPADMRFLHVSHDMTVDRAMLTGESNASKGTTESTNDNYLETRCIGLQGTHCVSGTAIGVVVATGALTVFSQIAKLANQPKTALTRIEKEIRRFILLISIIMITWILIIFAAWGGWLWKEHPNWIYVPALIVNCASVVIAYIPEGLPLAVTSSLADATNMMKKSQILCKSLKTFETLGSVSVVCSDKTGTLTRNKMSVTNFSVGTTAYTTDTAREAMFWNESTAINQLLAVAALCNDSCFDPKTAHLPLSEQRILGDATDQAALRFSESLGSVDALREAWTSVLGLAFDSRNKFMANASIATDSKSLESCISDSEKANFQINGNVLLTVKGAPDVLLDLCTKYVQEDGHIEPLNTDTTTIIRRMKDKWSSEGKRVILLARKIMPWDMGVLDSPTHEWERNMMKGLRNDLVFVGLLGMVDSPRDEIPSVMNTLRSAGIRSFMVTGDFGLTALAIARQCGMVTESSVHDCSFLGQFPDEALGQEKEKTPRAALLLTGSDLTKLNEHQWEQVCAYPEIVFSRTTSDQKLRIVREFQARGEIVAMTGDGVNDAPALKAADVGISLASGSIIAIEVADMVLLGSFAAVVEVVRYGRQIIDNQEKILAYLLPVCQWSKFWLAFTNVVLGLPQILSSFFMVTIHRFTDRIAAIALVREKPEAELLLRRLGTPKRQSPWTSS